MKNLIRNVAVLFAVIGGLFIAACETTEPCERDGYGWADVINATGVQLLVDCTKTSSGENQERLISNGSSFEYQMNDGMIYIWGSVYNSGDWYYDTYSLDACENLSYTWYLQKKKSIGTLFHLVITDVNGDVVQILDNFQVGEK